MSNGAHKFTPTYIPKYPHIYPHVYIRTGPVLSLAEGNSECTFLVSGGKDGLVCEMGVELWIYGYLSVISIVVMFYYYWCIRKPWSSSTVLYNNISIAQHHHTNNNL